jgi:1-deoxy-D-xylulose-5-phosphate reductoisomerase
MEKRRLAILGSTGSIGNQTLDVVRNFPDKFSIELLAAYGNSELLVKQAREFQPNFVVAGSRQAYDTAKTALADLDLKVYLGTESLCDLMGLDNFDLVVAAIVGVAGLESTYAAAKAGKNIALANKESLVVGGAAVVEALKKSGGTLLPIDSEHSAIFQCLAGEAFSGIEHLILTASGGPFRKYSREELVRAEPEKALVHPNWKMGPKITIDSATLMNKGLEIIEASWLFGLKEEKIKVVIHPESLIHSMVQFTDGNIKAQISLPDMRIPIHYALFYPRRKPGNYPKMSFSETLSMSFEPPDSDRFPALGLAREALRNGGSYPAVLNAANEWSVQHFLKGELSFYGITDLVEKAMFAIGKAGASSLEEVLAADKETREFCREAKGK